MKLFRVSFEQLSDLVVNAETAEKAPAVAQQIHDLLGYTGEVIVTNVVPVTSLGMLFLDEVVGLESVSDSLIKIATKK